MNNKLSIPETEKMLTILEEKKQIQVVIQNYSRLFPNTESKSKKLEHISRTLAMLNIKPYIIVVALQRLSMTRNNMPTLSEILDTCYSVEKSSGIISEKAPKVDNAWYEVLKHLSSIRPTSWSHPFIEQVVRNIGYKNIIENTDTARKDFFREYNELCDDELNKILLKNSLQDKYP